MIAWPAKGLYTWCIHNIYVMYMVQAMVEINEKTNRVLNVIKAQYGLKNKSDAIDLMAEKYEEEVMEEKVRPEFIKELEYAKKHGKFVKVDDFAKRYGIK